MMKTRKESISLFETTKIYEDNLHFLVHFKCPSKWAISKMQPAHKIVDKHLRHHVKKVNNLKFKLISGHFYGYIHKLQAPLNLCSSRVLTKSSKPARVRLRVVFLCFFFLAYDYFIGCSFSLVFLFFFFGICSLKWWKSAYSCCYAFCKFKNRFEIKILSIHGWHLQTNSNRSKSGVRFFNKITT